MQPSVREGTAHDARAQAWRAAGPTGRDESSPLSLGFVLTALATAVVNLGAHALTYVLFLKDFYARYPAGSPEFVRQLNKGSGQLVLWALLLSALALGTFIALVVRWSGARTFGAGLKTGLVFGGLFWAGINLGLYASSNLFSLPSALVDLMCSAGCVAVSAGVAAVLLRRFGMASLAGRRAGRPAPVQAHLG